MRLTKLGHACVRLESDDGRALVIDPGEWSEEAALDGVRDVLVTHEHFDHLDVEFLTRVAADNPRLHVWAPAPVAQNQLAGLGAAVTPVAPGDTVTAAGFAVQVVGGAHAEIYEGLPGCANVGYVVDGAVYFGDFGGMLWKLDAATGRVIWSHVVSEYRTTRASRVTSCAQAPRSPETRRWEGGQGSNCCDSSFGK